MRRFINCILIGAGTRGVIYSNYFLSNPDLGKIVAVAEPDEVKREKIAENHHIDDPANIVSTWQALSQRPKFADAVIIATPDALHCHPVLAFSRKGYHILLEKPMASNQADCELIVKSAIENKTMLSVCHVLRYTEYTAKIKQLIDSGIIGEIVSIEHLEPVGYWHQAHTFVRGNSRNSSCQSFMLLQKSCHDFDWLRYIIGKKCIRVASFGSLKHFKPENKPSRTSDRCTSCSIEKKCPYSAVKIYIRDRADSGHFGWPVDVVTNASDVDSIFEVLKTSPYGRCVYECDNDVVDHQVAILEFEDSVTVSFTMTGFSKQSDRKTKIFGTLGQLEGDGEKIIHFDYLTDKSFIEDITRSDGSILSGHGGGDYRIMEAFSKAVSLNDSRYILSDAEQSLETHRIVFAAEKSRLENCLVDI